jgi:hypothetical protein
MTADDVTQLQRSVHGRPWQTLIEFELPIEIEREHLGVDRVVEAVQKLNCPVRQLERLKRALVRSTQNMLERSRVAGSEAPLVVRVLVPEGSRAAQPATRGWGFFLVQTQRNNPPVPDGEAHYLVELFLYQEKNN